MSEDKINSELLNNLYNDIRIVEGQNLRTGKWDDNTMRRYIEKRIEKIVAKEESDEV